MNFILFIIFWLIGMAVTSFTLIPILIILMFGIPFTKALEKKGVLKPNNGIIKGYFVSLIILGTIFLTMIIITNSVFPNGLIGILFGGGMIFLLSLGKLGENESNVTDYFKTNERHLNNVNVEKLYSQSLDKENE